MKQFPHVQLTLRLARGILIASLFAAGSAFADNKSAPPVQATRATVADTKQNFEVGILKVERHGEHGTPVILVPGLASGAWVWDDTVRRLQGTHVWPGEIEHAHGFLSRLALSASASSRIDTARRGISNK